MRVIAGKARRLLLKTAPGFDTRPTLDKIKETLFNIIQADIPGSSFLDLFSGSGSIGIEALSRGSSFCVFVENDPKAVSCIEQNLAHTRLSDQALVIKKNVLSAINELSIKKQRFDIVYIDPPYNKGLEQSTLSALLRSGIIDEDSMVILEASKENELQFAEETGFTVLRIKDYKTNKHFFLKLNSDQSQGEAT